MLSDYLNIIENRLDITYFSLNNYKSKYLIDEGASFFFGLILIILTIHSEINATNDLLFNNVEIYFAI